MLNQYKNLNNYLPIFGDKTWFIARNRSVIKYHNFKMTVGQIAIEKKC